ncbi:UNVERIFIED_CONTAM: hypothetical protein Sradi_0963700 [Sesamum radiatum]|uniref:Uncharacterized protein n=1 Tax=Sesamum radiatum TaxID=300843 RepID=A0AAW2V5R2_SESRA
MGNRWSAVEPPPPMVLVPPLFDCPPLAARTRMLESSYNLLFGKLALRCLFHDYFEEAKHFSTRIMLKPIDDPHVDLIATVAGPLNHKPEDKIIGNAQFRWQRILMMRSCAYHIKSGFGVFGIFPVLLRPRLFSEDYGVMGFRYGSPNLSVGATVIPFSHKHELPKNAWLVSKMGRLTAGVQYEPQFGSKDGARYKNLANWSCAIGYGLGSGSPLSPSFNFGLELAKNSEVKNPLEENEIVGITNYIDFGFELQTRVDDNESSNNIQDSTFQVAASWQANKNFLLKISHCISSGKVGPLSSSIALAFKSWWKPSFTFSISAIRDRIKERRPLDWFNVENIREARLDHSVPVPISMFWKFDLMLTSVYLFEFQNQDDSSSSSKNCTGKIKKSSGDTQDNNNEGCPSQLMEHVVFGSNPESDELLSEFQDIQSNYWISKSLSEYVIPGNIPELSLEIEKRDALRGSVKEPEENREEDSRCRRSKLLSKYIISGPIPNLDLLKFDKINVDRFFNDVPDED